MSHTTDSLRRDAVVAECLAQLGMIRRALTDLDPEKYVVVFAQRGVTVAKSLLRKNGRKTEDFLTSGYAFEVYVILARDAAERWEEMARDPRRTFEGKMLCRRMAKRLSTGYADHVHVLVMFADAVRIEVCRVYDHAGTMALKWSLPPVQPPDPEPSDPEPGAA